jgi:formylglycine-generating enzyme required for sulfatase activity
MTATVMTVVALSLCAAAEPPVAPRGRDLQFELVDGTVITGRSDVKVITIRIASGNLLKIPVADLTELNVGLNDRRGLVERVEKLVKALDSTKTREDAQRELIALGPAVALIVSPHAADNVSARRAAVAEVLKAYKTWSIDHGEASEAMARPLKLRSTVQANVNTFVGTVTVKQFRIASAYGNVTVKLDEIRRIRPGFQAARFKPDRWIIELRDKTRLKGMVLNRSFRVQTPYGKMAVPPAQIVSAALAADGKGIRLQCQGADRIVGAIGPKTTMSFKTDKGKVNVPAGRIAAISAYRDLTIDLGKGVTMKLAGIPAGQFVMGSPKSEKDRKDHEGPQHRVSISKPFYMGVTEVTQEQYQRVTGKNPSKFRSQQNPVEQVSWKDAEAFCTALSKKLGRTVRLPTEAQWEYAYRAGTKARFSFGNADKNMPAHGWYSSTGGGKTHPVAQKLPNAWGLYDMHGNVWEWCADWYADSYTNAETLDPKGPATGKLRIIRGASFCDHSFRCRAAARARHAPDRNWNTIGFRVVIEVDSGAN